MILLRSLHPPPLPSTSQSAAVRTTRAAENYRGPFFNNHKVLLLTREGLRETIGDDFADKVPTGLKPSKPNLALFIVCSIGIIDLTSALNLLSRFRLV